MGRDKDKILPAIVFGIPSQNFAVLEDEGK
jgi:hypothetical protein